MFVPCPHCGFLVALIVRTDGAPQRCPRCEGLVEPLGADAAPVEAHGTPGDDTSLETTPADSVDASNAAPPTVASQTSVIEASAIEASAIETSPIDEAASDATDGPARQPDAPPRYEDAIAAAAVGTPARRSKRAPRPRRKGAPSFARDSAPTAPAPTHWGWYAGIAGLTLLLALQLLLAQRFELAADPRWRPLVAGACSVLRCEVPAWREPAAFTMLQRSVRPKTGKAGVLAVEASFRNDAQWPQPWPTLLLSLSDVDGRPVGVRAFTPREYRRTHSAADRLLPGQSATVTMDVVEPAPRIVAFTFDFR